MGNAYDAVATAFANDVAATLVQQGASAEGAFGNDVAATFNLGSGLSKWFTAVGGGGRQHIMILGDSNAQHEPANTYRVMQQLRTDLISFTGIAQGGEGFRQQGLAEWGRTGTWSVLDESGTVQVAGGATIGPGTAYDAAPYGKLYYATGNANIATWTKPGTFAAFDRFEVYGLDDDLLAAQFDYSVDGAAFVGGAWNLAPTTGIRLVSQAIVAAPATTLRIRGGNPILPTFLVGVAFYQGTSGLVVHNVALAGSTVTTGTGINSANRLALIEDLQPKLTIVWTGTNEFSNWAIQDFGSVKQMTLDEFYKSYKKIVDKARLYGDVLMVYPQATQPGPANQLQQQPIPRQQQDFERVARKIAYETDSGFISMHSLWGQWSRHNARGFAFDAHHLSQTGHAAAFKVVSRAIRRVS